MPMRTFMIPVTDGGEACDAMNQFTRHVRVLSTDRRFVELGLQSYWSILVDYLDVKPETVSEGEGRTKSRSKIDYREILAPEVFALFAKLREFRKRLAQEEGVPVAPMIGEWSRWGEFERRETRKTMGKQGPETRTGRRFEASACQFA